MREMNYFLRYYRPLKEGTQKSDYIFYSPLHRLRRAWNLLPESCRSSLMQDPTKSAVKILTLEHF